ncbi:MAG: hypothetical protein WKG01_29275 [Kofleriaceae bacterium]
MLYRFVPDQPGATHAAEAAAKLYFALPPVSIDQLPRETDADRPGHA